MRGQITVQVIRSDLGSLSSKATCISIACGESKYQTQSVRGHETVEWNEETMFQDARDDEALVFKVKTKKLLGFETVGSVSVPVGELPLPGQEPIQKTVVVDDRGSTKRRVSITYRCWVSAVQSPSETSLQRSKSSPASPRKPESITSLFRRHSERSSSSPKRRVVAATYNPNSVPLSQKHRLPVSPKSHNLKSRSLPVYRPPIPEIIITPPPPEMFESFSLDPSKTVICDVFQYDSDFSEESLDYDKPQDAVGLSSAEHVLESDIDQSEETFGTEVTFGSTFSPSLDSIAEEIPEIPTASSETKSLESQGDDLRLSDGAEDRQQRLQVAVAAALAYCSDRHEQRQREMLAKAAEPDPHMPLGSLSAPLMNPPVPKFPIGSQSGPLPVVGPSFSLPLISFSSNEIVPTMVPPESPLTGLASAFSGISFLKGGFLRKNDFKPLPPRNRMSDLYRQSDLMIRRESLDLDFDGPDANWNPPNEDGRSILGIPSV
eukprot:comp24262_c4_seq3/m.45063 comp24262_c4_seq3/g.45063  ORF comp24262_c4_seq3/g.45063 comp24262_c4_seq3/m.45063 type:complete len:491 (-) comp24262_c4_seq3:630-2102(-)